MKRPDLKKQYAVCVKNEGYPASLEIRKLYQVIPDASSADKGLIRVVDESQEDFLYPKEYFIPIDLPQAAAEAFSSAA